MQTICDGLQRGWTRATAAGHRKQIGLVAVRAHHGGEQSVGIFAMLQNRRARAIAEKDAGVAVFPIYNGREFFRADHQNGFITARQNKLLADFQRINETRTRGLNVERRRARRAELALHEARGRRKRHIGRERGDDDQINLIGGDASHFHRALGGFRGEVGSEFVGGGDAPFLDARARGNPFVRSLDHFFQIGIGKDFFRHIRTDAGNGTGAANKIMFCARIFHDWAGSVSASRILFAAAMSRAMVWLICVLTALAVTRMALVTARSRADACALKTSPLKPSSGAPP